MIPLIFTRAASKVGGTFSTSDTDARVFTVHFALFHRLQVPQLRQRFIGLLFLYSPHMNLMQPLSIFSQEISGSVFPRFSMSWVTSWAFRSLITFFLPMRNNCGTANTDETTFDGKLLIICNIEIAVGAEGRVDTASIYQYINRSVRWYIV